MAESGTPLFGRTLLLWAICLTVVGSFLTVKLSTWRRWLERKQAAVRKNLSMLAPGAASPMPAMQDSITPLSPPLSPSLQADARAGISATPPLQAQASSNSPDTSTMPRQPTRGLSTFLSPLSLGTSVNMQRTLAHIDRQLGRRAALAQIGSLFEATLAWVAGCAWCDAVVELTTQADYPTPRVVLMDTLLAWGFVVLAIAYIILSGQPTSIADRYKRNREAVERYFVCYALSFIVGWSWIVMLRDYETLLSDLLTQVARPSPHPNPQP